MKKYILPILLLMMFIPFVVNAETCNTDKITISSISVESKSDNVEELDKAVASGKKLNLNILMSEVGDTIKYKIIVKNDSKEDYLINKNSFNISSDYIKYTIESEGDTNIVKANSSKAVYLKVNYANEVPDNAFESGEYNDNKTMTINLSNSDIKSVPNTIKNPNTGIQSYILILFIILFVSISTYILLRKKKYAKFMILIIVSAIIIPMSAYALCKFDIIVESNVNIVKHSSLYVYTNNLINYAEPDKNIVIINQAIPNYIQQLSTPEEAMAGSYGPYFLRHKISNDIVTESYVGFMITSEMAAANPGMVAGTYYLRGGEEDESSSEEKPIFEANKEIIKEAFGYSNNPSRCQEQSDYFNCSVSGLFAYTTSSVSVESGDLAWTCYVSREGKSYCGAY